MKVLVDCHSLEKEKTGKPFFTLNLLYGISEIKNESKDFEFFLACKKAFDLGFSLPQNFRFLELGEKTLNFHLNLIKKTFSKEFDIFWSATSFIPASFSKTPTVSFIYDLVSFIRSEFKKNKKAEILEKLLIGRVLKNSDRIITISESTKKDLLKMFPKYESKTFVIKGAPRFYPESKESDESIIKKYGLEKNKYIFYLGTIEPRKNILNLIQSFNDAFLRKKRKCNDIPYLVLAGKKGWYFDEIFSTLEKLELKEKIKFLGYTPDENVPALIRNCLFFSYIPFYEGFGLPIVEAISFGKSCLTSNTSSLPEALGNCGIAVSPNNTEEIKNAILSLWSDEKLRKVFENNTKEWRKKFDRKENAKKLIKIFRSLK